jgi:hypothetical protein
MNYIANARHIHNPKAEGSNPSPTTNQLPVFLRNLSLHPSPNSFQRNKIELVDLYSELSQRCSHALQRAGADDVLIHQLRKHQTG